MRNRTLNRLMEHLSAMLARNGADDPLEGLPLSEREWLLTLFRATAEGHQSPRPAEDFDKTPNAPSIAHLAPFVLGPASSQFAIADEPVPAAVTDRSGGLSVTQWVDSIENAQEGVSDQLFQRVIALEHVAKLPGSSNSQSNDSSARPSVLPDRRVTEAVSTGVVSLFARPRARIVPLFETFLPLAAASDSTNHGMVVQGGTGIWQLEVYAGISETECQEGLATIVLTVNAEHRASYEGGSVRVIAHVEGEPRVLAQGRVENGQFVADCSIKGLNLKSRDPLSVEFLLDPTP